MGNCQAVDNATLVIQHPNGKVDKLFFPVSAAEIIKANPGHYVAQLLTTTLYSSTAAAPSAAAAAAAPKTSNTPLRVTRIKLLRPTDTLVLGHVYRLVTSEEVMKGLWAKKQAKMQQQKNGSMAEKHSSDFEAVVKKKDDMKKSNNQERHRSRNNTQVNSAASKSRAIWQPALKSISEAGS
ncbi:D-ribose-binding periplasmic protein [Perilla frutescens var. hirtella]|nr:D-ribose-binding periplasmic protein [Perilla frutescens var. frutescens]KAH6801292.1 D-ribose-binding periplasmic protein [Perilla frutescens var. hirtella]